MAARTRADGRPGDTSLLESINNSSTRLEPPSVRQRQRQRQQEEEGAGGRHASLMRNATIREFLAEYPKPEWPAVLEVSESHACVVPDRPSP